MLYISNQLGLWSVYSRSLLDLQSVIFLSLTSANVDFPTDLDYSFHAGQLNTTLNSVPLLQPSETGCSDSQLESCGNTSHYAVPHNDNSVASLTSEVPLRDELTDNTDFYDHDLPVSKKAKSTAAAYQEPPANPFGCYDDSIQFFSSHDDSIQFFSSHDDDHGKWNCSQSNYICCCDESIHSYGDSTQ